MTSVKLQKIVFALTVSLSFINGHAQVNVVPDEIKYAVLKDSYENLDGCNWLNKPNWPTLNNWPHLPPVENSELDSKSETINLYIITSRGRYVNGLQC